MTKRVTQSNKGGATLNILNQSTFILQNLIIRNQQIRWKENLNNGNSVDNKLTPMHYVHQLGAAVYANVE